MIKSDEIIEEIRKYRDEFAGSFDYDLRKIVQELQRLEKKSGREVVSRPPRRPIRKRIAS